MSSLPAMPRMKKQQVCKIPQCEAERELKEVDKGKREMDEQQSSRVQHEK